MGESVLVLELHITKATVSYEKLVTLSTACVHLGRTVMFFLFENTLSVFKLTLFLD